MTAKPTLPNTALGRVVASQNGSMATSYEYDEYARLVRRNFTDTVLGDGIERYTYDATTNNGISDGTLTSMRMISGGTINYQYDGLQRLTNKDIAGEIWEAFSYSNTQVSSKINYIGNTRVHSLHYLYDSNGNITKETLSEGGAQNSRNYTYDKLNQLLKVTHSTGRTENYTYDNAGNIKTFNNGSTQNHTLAYEDTRGWKDLLTKVDNETITYDKIGNPLTYYDGYKYTFTWTEGRRLESVEYHINDTTSCTTYYQYDNAGLRTKKLNPDGTYTTYHIADGRYAGETLFRADGSRRLYMRYIYDENESVVGISLWKAGYSSAWEDYYFLKNLQGDVLRVYKASNNSLAASYTYDAWGNIVESHNYQNFDGIAISQLNPFRYRGYYYDNETWFYYLQSRYYDPAIGRFINADVLTSTGQGFLGYNMFAYCLNNPLNYSDPYGDLAFPGEIHNAVVERIATMYGYNKEQRIAYKNGRYGRADLISNDGRIWDVKRDKPKQIAAGKNQVNKYVSNTWKNSPSTPLSVGDDEIESDSFYYKSFSGTYKVSYRYAGDGVIAYDYKLTDSGQKSFVNAALTLGAAAVVIFMGLSAIGAVGAVA